MMNKQLTKLIEWHILLLDHYKSLGLCEEEVMVIFMCDYCMNRGETLVTPEIIALKMTLEYSTIDRILSNLMNRGYISTEENNGKLYTSLHGIQDLLIKTFLLSIKKEPSTQAKSKSKTLYTLFENEFGRPLTYLEMETIRNWLDEEFSEETIKSALNEAVLARAKNIRYIDKILLEWKQQQERKKEGYSTVNDQYRANIEETLKIANLQWVDKKKKK